MNITKNNDVNLRMIMVGLITLLILFIFSGLIKPLIVPPGTEVKLEVLLYNIFSGATMGVFSIAFINKGFIEKNTLLKITCLVFGFCFGIMALLGQTLLLTFLFAGFGLIYVAQLFFIISLGFTTASAGIYLLRRA